MAKTLLSRGAEAQIFLFDSPPDEDISKRLQPGDRLDSARVAHKLPLAPAASQFPAVQKHRVPKTWRHPALDHRLRKARHKQEVGCILKAAGANLPVPHILAHNAAEMTIWSEYIEGDTLKNVLNSRLLSADELARLFAELGTVLGKLHDLNIIHEDLTSSNMLVRKADKKLFLIDFGLSHISLSIEDKAVDLYVLERAFLSTHPSLEKEIQIILDSYFSATKNSAIVHKQLETGISIVYWISPIQGPKKNNAWLNDQLVSLVSWLVG